MYLKDIEFSNQLKSKPGKCNLLLNNSCKKKIKIEDFPSESSMQEKLLGITIDINLKLASHVENLCENVGLKTSCFRPKTYLHGLNKETIIINCVFLYPSSVIALLHGYVIQNFK